MPRCFSISIQSEVAWREALRAFTEPAIWIAPEKSRSFSVSVVLPASGCEMMAKVRRRFTSGLSSVMARQVSPVRPERLRRRVRAGARRRADVRRRRLGYRAYRSIADGGIDRAVAGNRLSERGSAAAAARIASVVAPRPCGLQPGGINRWPSTARTLRARAGRARAPATGAARCGAGCSRPSGRPGRSGTARRRARHGRCRTGGRRRSGRRRSWRRGTRGWRRGGRGAPTAC